jgi:hypothetical protein
MYLTSQNRAHLVCGRDEEAAAITLNITNITNFVFGTLDGRQRRFWFDLLFFVIVVVILLNVI